MNFMKLILMLLLSIVANSQTISSNLKSVAVRKVEIPNHFYVVEYAIQQGGMVSVPLTYPTGQPHYSAAISVYEVVNGSKQIIGKPFDGEYTDGECFEDNAVTLTERALKSAGGLTPEIAAAFEGIRAKAAFEGQPLFRQSGQVLEITPKGKRDLKAVVVDGKTVWGKVPIEKDITGFSSNGIGTITVSSGLALAGKR